MKIVTVIVIKMRELQCDLQTGVIRKKIHFFPLCWIQSHIFTKRGEYFLFKKKKKMRRILHVQVGCIGQPSAVVRGSFGGGQFLVGGFQSFPFGCDEGCESWYACGSHDEL